MLELVVARYTENLNWLRKLPTGLHTTVYDKSPDHSAGPAAIVLPNIGREAHTYLHHIVSRYDTLAEWTVFCQGKPFDHAYDFKKSLREFALNPIAISPAGFRWLGHLIDTDDDQGERLFRPWSKNEDNRGLDLRSFHHALFDSDGPATYTFVLGAQFAVHCDLVRRQPRAFYERALAVSINFPDAAHCFERSWDLVFGLVGIDRGWLAGRLTVQLKLMKHQSAEGQNSGE
ncbi:DUF3431 domain-containing protein [Spirosoma soli]|uniref:DUF3431 domain-containing protein n=1 Tax=Spirosoma soli TaxID=1770529 RepID=A0ABW5M7X6_9BACT